MFREALSELLSDSSESWLVECFGDLELLSDRCEAGRVHGVILPHHTDERAAAGVISRLRRTRPSIAIVCTFSSHRVPPDDVDGIVSVSKSSAFQSFENALLGAGTEPPDFDGIYLDQYHREFDNVTSREFQVLVLIGAGLTTVQIGHRLGISAKTVESRRQSLYRKLGVQNQSAAVSVAMRTGLLGTSMSPFQRG